MSTWLQMLNKNDSRLTRVPSSGNTSTHVRWEGPKKSISGPLLSVAFPFPLFNLFEGFCFSGHFQERKPLFFHAPSSWSESEGQPHLHILWGNRSRAGDRVPRAGARDSWGPPGGAGRRPNASGLSRGHKARPSAGKAGPHHFHPACAVSVPSLPARPSSPLRWRCWSPAASPRAPLGHPPS